ncbi:MAG: nucleoside phosphorylase [Planctomycetota bacterium]
MPYESAEHVQTPEGVQYHVGTGPGDLAEIILMCGDPARARRVAEHFDEIEVTRENREYVTLTGPYRGERLSVVATGIGCDNMEIAVIELAKCLPRAGATFIRLGSCGALQPGIHIGDLVISTGAVRLENTSTYFVEPGYPAVASPDVTLAILEAARRGGVRHFLGLTACAPGFYGAQGRDVGLPLRDPDLPKRLGAQGVLNFEMETSALFTLGGLVKARTGAACVVFADRTQNQFVDHEAKKAAEDSVIRLGLDAVEVLRAMDRARGDNLHWCPSDGLKE